MSKGFGPLGNIVKQAQELQERLGQVQEEAAARTVESSAGGGMVTAVVSGRLEVLELRIDPEVFKSSDREMLQDLVRAAWVHIRTGMNGYRSAASRLSRASRMVSIMAPLAIPTVGRRGQRHPPR